MELLIVVLAVFLIFRAEIKKSIDENWEDIRFAELYSRAQGRFASPPGYGEDLYKDKARMLRHR